MKKNLILFPTRHGIVFTMEPEKYQEMAIRFLKCKSDEEIGVVKQEIVEYFLRGVKKVSSDKNGVIKGGTSGKD